MTSPNDPGGRASRARQLLRGLEGPEGSTPPHVALVVAAPARAWLESVRPHLGRDQSATLADLEAWVDSLDLLASIHRRSLMSGAVSDLGQSGSEDGEFRRTQGEASYIAVSEAADLLGCSARQVRRLADRQALVAIRPGHEWLIDRASVENFRRDAA